jgi:hypothetical protein
MDRSHDYSERATRVEDVAKATKDPRLRHELEDIANQWRDLAWQVAELDASKEVPPQ